MMTAVESMLTAHLNILRSANIDVAVLSRGRTVEEQAALYAVGRTSPGTVVTDEKPGESYINYGAAYEIAPVRVNNLVDMDVSSPAAKRRLAVIGKMGEAVGMTWGGMDRPFYFYWPDAGTIASLKKGAKK